MRAAAVGHEPYANECRLLYQFLARLNPCALYSLELFLCTDARLAYVTERLTGVTRLQIGLNYEAVDLRLLARLPNLTHLDISEAKNVPSEHLNVIGNFSRLRYLNLQWGAPIRDANMPAIAQCMELTDLALRGCISCTSVPVMVVLLTAPSGRRALVRGREAPLSANQSLVLAADQSGAHWEQLVRMIIRGDPLTVTGTSWGRCQV